MNEPDRPHRRADARWRRPSTMLAIFVVPAVIEEAAMAHRSSDMKDAFLRAFVARWTRMRERYLANPEEHGVKHARLVTLWKRFGGRCHLCGGRVPHPILELDAVDEDNAPMVDHATPRAEGGGCEQNLRLAHRWCNRRRGRRPLNREIRRLIREEVAGRFGEASART